MAGQPHQEIIIPVTGSVDTRSIQSIIQHRIHQRSYHRNQLGLVRIAYPGARHSRGEHELGSSQYAYERAQRLYEEGYLNKQDVIDCRVNALIHDDSHGPYSHITDPIVTKDHNLRAAPIILAMSEAIEEAGSDPERQVRMILKKDKLGTLVSDRQLGAEKIDYLARDSYHTGMGGMLNPRLFLHIVSFRDEQILVNAEMHQIVMALMSHHWTMYDRVYYFDRVVICERFMQRMISMLLGQFEEEPELTEEELLGMIDSQLDYRLQFAKNPIVVGHYQRYLDENIPVAAILLQLDPYQKIHWTPGESITHLSAPDEVFAERMRKPKLLYQLEREIETALGLPTLSILATPAAPKRRFEPPEILFQTNSGIEHLRDRDPLEWAATLAKARRHARFYIATDPEFRDKVSNPDVAREVASIVTRYANE